MHKSLLACLVTLSSSPLFAQGNLIPLPQFKSVYDMNNGSVIVGISEQGDVAIGLPDATSTVISPATTINNATINDAGFVAFVRPLQSDVFLYRPDGTDLLLPDPGSRPASVAVLTPSSTVYWTSVDSSTNPVTSYLNAYRPDGVLDSLITPAGIAYSVVSANDQGDLSLNVSLAKDSNPGLALVPSSFPDSSRVEWTSVSVNGIAVGRAFNVGGTGEQVPLIWDEDNGVRELDLSGVPLSAGLVSPLAVTESGSILLRSTASQSSYAFYDEITGFVPLVHPSRTVLSEICPTADYTATTSANGVSGGNGLSGAGLPLNAESQLLFEVVYRCEERSTGTNYFVHQPAVGSPDGSVELIPFPDGKSLDQMFEDAFAIEPAVFDPNVYLNDIVRGTINDLQEVVLSAESYWLDVNFNFFLDQAAFFYSMIPDTDGDGVSDDIDNCPTVANADQTDDNGDGFGDVCVPTNTSVDPDATIGPGLIAGDRSRITGDAIVGSNLTIGNRTSIFGPNVVGNDVEIGNRSSVWPGANVGNDVSIGNRTTIFLNSDILDNATIGNRTFVSRNVTVGTDASVGNRVVIGRGVVVCPEASIGNGAWIGRNNLIDTGSLVPANARLNGQSGPAPSLSDCSVP